MRKLVIICISYLLSLGCSSQDEKSYIKSGGEIIYGKPKMLEFIAYNPLINKNGEIIKGNILTKRVWGGVSYNGSGKLLYDKEGRHTHTYDYKLGSKEVGKLIKEEYFKNNTIKTSTLYPPYKAIDYFFIEQYDANDNLTYESHYSCLSCFPKNKEVLPNREYIYIYDSLNNLTKKKIYDYDYGYNYDKPRKISDSTINSYQLEYKQDQLYKSQLFQKKYDSLGIIQEEYVDKAFIYSNNKEGVLIKKQEQESEYYLEYYPNGIMKKHNWDKDKYYLYNKEGYLTKVKFYMSENPVTYTYDKEDKYGNWTRVIVSKKGKPVIYGERTITYYE